MKNVTAQAQNYALSPTQHDPTLTVNPTGSNAAKPSNPVWQKLEAATSQPEAKKPGPAAGRSQKLEIPSPKP